MSTIGKRWRDLDAVFHCIAYADRDDLNRPFTEVSREGYRMAMEISAYSLNAIARGAAPLMRERGGGSITALTYNAVERAVPGYSAMAPAKAALETGVKYLAMELGPSRIRVNAISAGPIRTLSASAVKGITALRRWTEEAAPLRENITIEDVGNTAVFLASDMARMITGNIIFVDSGAHILAAQGGAKDLV
jgi:enoyl-[acyl-carrier protein] reductase I